MRTLNQSGEYEGFKWRVTHLSGREFLLEVGDVMQRYECEFPLEFGMDSVDQSNINNILNELQEKVERGLEND